MLLSHMLANFVEPSLVIKNSYSKTQCWENKGRTVVVINMSFKLYRKMNVVYSNIPSKE